MYKDSETKLLSQNRHSQAFQKEIAELLLDAERQLETFYRRKN